MKKEKCKNKSLLSGIPFLIFVNAYSGLALNAGTSGDERTATRTKEYNPKVNNDKWKAQAVSGKTDVFCFKSLNFTNRYMDMRDASDIDGAYLQIHAGNSTNAQRFKLVKQGDGSFVVGLFLI